MRTCSKFRARAGRQQICFHLCSRPSCKCSLGYACVTLTRKSIVSGARVCPTTKSSLRFQWTPWPRPTMSCKATRVVPCPTASRCSSSARSRARARTLRWSRTAFVALRRQLCARFLWPNSREFHPTQLRVASHVLSAQRCTQRPTSHCCRESRDRNQCPWPSTLSSRLGPLVELVRE